MSTDSARTETEMQPDDQAVPTSASDIRNRSQRIVTSPLSGNTYRIRDYAPVDALRLQRLPKILKDPKEAEKPEDEQDPNAEEKTDPDELTDEDKIQNRLQFSEAVIEACCLEPRFTCDPDEVNDEILHVTEISTDAYWLAEKIVEKWADAQSGKSTGSPEEDSTPTQS